MLIVGPLPFVENYIESINEGIKTYCAESTRKIAHVQKIKDKPSGGYIMGQSLVFEERHTQTIPSA